MENKEEEMESLSINNLIETHPTTCSKQQKISNSNSHVILEKKIEKKEEKQVVKEDIQNKKILIKDFLDLQNDLASHDRWVKNWQVIEEWAKKIPQVRSCFEHELNNKTRLLRKIFGKDVSNTTDDEIKLVVDLCKYFDIKNNNDFYTFEFLRATSTYDLCTLYCKLMKKCSDKFSKVGRYGNFESRLSITDNEAKIIIMELPLPTSLFENMKKIKISLEQILVADDFCDFLNDEKQKELEKILDVNCYIKTSEDTKVFNADKMKEIGDCLLKRTDILNNRDNAKKAVKFYYQALPDLIDKKMKDYTKETNDNKGGYLRKPIPVFSFAYELLKRYKAEDGTNDFQELQSYIKECTQDSLRKTSEWVQAVDNFLLLKSSYEKKSTSTFKLDCRMNDHLNKMLDFLYKNRIIAKSTFVTGFNVSKNKKFSCSWLEWFVELWQCLLDDFSAFWKKSYNITKAVILKKFLDKFDNISVTLNQANNQSVRMPLSQLLTEVNEFIPISETAKLQK